MKALEILVFGVVQGVGFRYYTYHKALELGVKGQVENLSDGSVRIIAEAHEKTLLNFLDWCHDGPTSSKVQRLEYNYIHPSGVKEFVIKR